MFFEAVYEPFLQIILIFLMAPQLCKNPEAIGENLQKSLHYTLHSDH